MSTDRIGFPFRVSDVLVAAWLVALALASQQAYQAGSEAHSTPVTWNWVQPPSLFPPA